MLTAALYFPLVNIATVLVEIKQKWQLIFYYGNENTENVSQNKNCVDCITLYTVKIGLLYG